jgi:glycerol-3-phosphate dehydrogenase (NAD(P)+)
MLRVAVLGAGYMGSAVTFPLSARGVRVNLWGTWLDDAIIEASRNGVHPKLKVPLPGGVHLFRSGEITGALDGVDAVYIAVTSEGFASVFKAALTAIKKTLPILTLTKGFIRSGGHVSRISEAAEIIYRECFPSDRLLWASIGGPVKAVELAREMPTSTVYGTLSGEIRDLTGSFGTGYYRIFPNTDVIGVELSSALKNVYAVALGICDGMYGTRFPELYHNLRAFVFTQAVKEMAFITEKAGGRRETVSGLPGIGDLHLTASSGRNRRFGCLIGGGKTGKEVYDLMTAEGETAEGYGALEHGVDFVRDLGIPIESELPLLSMLHGVVFGAGPLAEEMGEFVRNCRA